jgi:hypothetical protein
MTDEKKLTWWQLMWKNFYIQLFALAIVFLAGVIIKSDSFYSLAGLIIGLAIPIGMMIMISYFGFYKFWREYNNLK